MRTTAKDLFHFNNEFGKIHNIRDEITVYFVDDQLQKTEIVTYGMLLLYFYENLFAPDYNSTIVNDKKLTNNTMLKLLREIFVLDKGANKQKIDIFPHENDIKFST